MEIKKQKEDGNILIVVTERQESIQIHGILVDSEFKEVLDDVKFDKERKTERQQSLI